MRNATTEPRIVRYARLANASGVQWEPERAALECNASNQQRNAATGHLNPGQHYRLDVGAPSLYQHLPRGRSRAPPP